VGTLGRLEPVKGLDVLLDAVPLVAEAVPGARFLLAGGGPEREALAARVASDPVLSERVTLLGFVPSAPAFLGMLDCYCLPSRSEGFNTTILEAMALGVPVVATDVGGTREAVRDGETGRLVPSGDPAALAVALIGGISALAVSPGMRASLSRLLVDPQPKFTDFRMSDDVAYLEPVVPDGFEGDFYPSYIPAGFSPAGANRGHAYYLTDDEQRVLYYNEYDENTVLGLDTEDADVTYTKVGGTDAMLVQKNGLSSVVWSFADRFFLVSLTGSSEEAMKIAESLVLID
jgi:hypothetical protein